MKYMFCIFGGLLASSVLAHEIIPSPQKYAVGTGYNTNGTIERVTDAAIGAEGYRLSVTPERIVIASGDEAGAFYAGQTLKQMKTDAGWPVAEIEDAPRFRVRGLMIDESRHFFGKAFILSLLDHMADYKLNTLHWHLNDDCGFRQPFAFDPKMATAGATRPFKFVLDVQTGTAWDPDPNVQQELKEAAKTATGPAYGPFAYTVADIKEVLAAAAARHIRVIPELEVPGHATGLLRAHPEFCCLDKDGKPLDPEKCMEICVGNPDAIAWYDKAFEETFALFPDPIFHIGGDEVNPKHWNACPRCQAFMKEHGIKDWNGLQAWVTRRYAEMGRKYGKRMGGWDDIYQEQDAPKDAVIWCPSADVFGCAVAEGYDVIRCDNETYYIDWPQGVENDPCQYIGWKPEVNTFAEIWLTRVDWNLPERLRGHVLGVIAPNWAEFTRSAKELEWKIWPRALALAENLWKHGGNPISGRYADFRRRAEVHTAKLRQADVNCAPIPDEPVSVEKALQPEHVALEVADPDAMEKWWCENLGFKVTLKRPGGSRFLADATGRLAFEVYGPKAGAEPVDHWKTDDMKLHFGLASRDAEADMRRLVAAGATCGAKDDAPGLKGYLMRDPQGIPFQIIQRAKSILK